MNKMQKKPPNYHIDPAADRHLIFFAHGNGSELGKGNELIDSFSKRINDIHETEILFAFIYFKWEFWMVHWSGQVFLHIA